MTEGCRREKESRKVFEYISKLGCYRKIKSCNYIENKWGERGIKNDPLELSEVVSWWDLRDRMYSSPFSLKLLYGQSWCSKAVTKKKRSYLPVLHDNYNATAEKTIDIIDEVVIFMYVIDNENFDFVSSLLETSFKRIDG